MSTFLRLAGRVGDRISLWFPEQAESCCLRARQQIVSAGDVEVTPTEILGLQVMFAVAFPLIWGGGASLVPVLDFLVKGPQAVLSFLALSWAGFMAPTWSLKDRGEGRRKQIIRQLPDMIDLLTVCVEAGLDFLLALHVVVDNQPPGALKDEFTRFLKQLEMGVPRIDALHELSARVVAYDLTSVCAVLVQASKLGSPLGPVLRMQSELLRIRRGQRAEKQAAEATVKVLAPLALCIFPAVFIAILGPVVLSIMKVM